MTDKICDKIMQHAAAEAGGIALEAKRLLECAIRDGDDCPSVKVTVQVEVTKANGIYVITRRAEAKRVQSVKTDGESTEYNPNQPELPGVEEAQ
jgi:hypothetical protein